MNQETLAVLIFSIAYAGIAFGSFPGLKIDRTGIALLGAIGMLAAGVLTQAEAFAAIDLPTILLLYSLMVLSAQFSLAGVYTRVALSITAFTEQPAFFLFVLMAASAVLSALVVNDIVCFAFTPVICVALLRASLNPAPFLIGLACASNIGSAATIIGNPQNMLIGQVGGLDFGAYLLRCAPPTILSLGVAYLVIAGIYRGRLRSSQGGPVLPVEEGNKYNSHQALKGLVLGLLLLTAFFLPVPRELAAIVVAGILLCSRRVTTRSLLGLIDWHLITLFCGLFIIIAGIVKYGIPMKFATVLASLGLDIANAMHLSFLTLLLSNVVSNVPAVMLLLHQLDLKAPEQLYLLALVSTFAGNFLIIGSIANLITFEQAKRYNIPIGFLEHAKAGIPITILSVLIAITWLALSG